MVGLVPLFATELLTLETLEKLPNFKRRLEWSLKHRLDLQENFADLKVTGVGEQKLLSIVCTTKLKKILEILLDEAEFFSPYGIRSLSKFHEQNPYSFDAEGQHYFISYEPAESLSGMFGGNSNWRGPVWFPMNFLLIESLQKYYQYLGDDFKVECPTGSGNYLNLEEVAQEISKRLVAIFAKDADNQRPVYGGIEKFQTDPYWQDLILFHEYFHGDEGAGLGANHQTGWTGLVAKLIQQQVAQHN